MTLTFFTSKPRSYRDEDPRYDIGAALVDAFQEAGFEDAEYNFNEFGIELDLGDETLQANSYEELPDNVKNALAAAYETIKIVDENYYCDLDEILY